VIRGQRQITNDHDKNQGAAGGSRAPLELQGVVSCPNGEVLFKERRAGTLRKDPIDPNGQNSVWSVDVIQSITITPEARCGRFWIRSWNL